MRFAAAAEQMHTRARFDFHRLDTALNRTQYTVQTTRVLEPDPVMGLEADEGVFRPEAFGGSRG